MPRFGFDPQSRSSEDRGALGAASSGSGYPSIGGALRTNRRERSMSGSGHAKTAWTVNQEVETMVAESQEN